ncbi:hypothetical protein C0992_003904 [Termitomyces sp. T32_za158]|nr:hypothetical protein C0992_003904 [Termitomyces sp. T32_za158]
MSAKGKFTTRKRTLDDAERLRRLFTSLCAQMDGGHMFNALKTCDKILRIDPTDADAHKTKLFLLLHTEQYDATLPLIDAAHHRFELAYTLYRLQRENDALRVLDDSDDRASTHLLAQMNYRTGSYARAVELYTQLLESAEPDSEEHTDILTNLRAAQAYHDFISTGYLRALGSLPASITSAPLPLLTGAVRGPTAPAVTHEPEHAPPAPKKPRAKHVPPGVVPGVTPPPDPERWLKKSERSSVLGKRRRAQGGGVTQGSVAAVVTSETPVSADTKVKAKARKRK